MSEWHKGCFRTSRCEVKTKEEEEVEEKFFCFFYCLFPFGSHLRTPELQEHHSLRFEEVVFVRAVSVRQIENTADFGTTGLFVAQP